MSVLVVKSDLEEIKEIVVAYSGVISTHFPDGIEKKSMENS